jgi:hypothetical protein
MLRMTTPLGLLCITTVGCAGLRSDSGGRESCLGSTDQCLPGAQGSGDCQPCPQEPLDGS